MGSRGCAGVDEAQLQRELRQTRFRGQATVIAAIATPGAIGQALHASALTQEGEHGVSLLQDAVGHLARSPAPLEHARALIDHGSALRRRGDRAAARDPLRPALTSPLPAAPTRSPNAPAATPVSESGATPRPASRR